MSNSPLVNYTKISPNRGNTINGKWSPERTAPVDTISPHCVVGQCSVETVGNIFAPTSRQASSNYGIGVDGRIGMYCEEKDRSWCTSSAANDNRATTIECASDTKHPYAMNNKVYNALVELCVDICKRYNKTKLLWFGDKNKTLSYKPQKNEMIITVHRWFANKSCPGDWLYNRLGELATTVTQRLGGTGATTNTPSNPKPSTGAINALYRVRKSWADSKSQIGAFKSLDNAKATANKNPGYSVFDNSGKVVYAPGGTSTSFKPYLVRVTTDVLNIRKGAGTNYGTNGAIRDKGTYTIVEEATGAGATLWGKLKSGAGWISLDFTTKV